MGAFVCVIRKIRYSYSNWSYLLQYATVLHLADLAIALLYYYCTECRTVLKCIQGSGCAILFLHLMVPAYLHTCILYRLYCGLSGVDPVPQSAGSTEEHSRAPSQSRPGTRTPGPAVKSINYSLQKWPVGGDHWLADFIKEWRHGSRKICVICRTGL